MGTFRDLLRYLYIYRRYLGRRMYLVFVLAAMTAFAQGFGITLLLPLLRASQSNASAEDMGTAEQLLHDLLSWMGIANSIIGILVFIALVFIGKGALRFAKGGYQGYLQAQLLRELKTKLFDAYTGMDYRYYIRQNAGHFINVINQQVNRFFRSFISFVGFFTQIIKTAFYFAFAFAITWRFSAMALVIGTGLLFLFKYMNNYVRRLSRQRSEEMSQLNSLLVQSLQSLKYVISTDQTKNLRPNVISSIKRLTGYILRQNLARHFTLSLKEPVSVLIVVVIIATQVIVFNDPIAPLFVALLLFHRGMQAIIAMQTGWQKTMDRIGSVEMVDDELEEVERNQERGGKRQLGCLREGIELNDVCFAYSEESQCALNRVNVTIPAGMTVAFVGESGAGKSTLVDMLTLMLKPQRGEVLIDGIPYDEVDLSTWRAQIGYVSQEMVIFDDTVAKNISLWGRNVEENPELQKRIFKAAQRAHADCFIRDLPNGYQTVVGDRGVRLSGGQRQRLFLARELFKRPNVLLLDEATSALDTESERHVQQSIDALKGEITVVIVAHRLSTIKNVDYVYVLSEGRVSEEGTYNQLQERKASQFREMLDKQSV